MTHKTISWATERYGESLSGSELQPRIATELKRRRIRMVVIDDDPTGIQTVHGCLLLTHFTPELVEAALDDEAPFFYLLVNSRAMTEEEACRVVREAVEAVLAANRSRGYNLIFVSRSDSTLRGHFPAENRTITEVLNEAGLTPLLPTLFCPAFFEAGRMTIEGIHYMAQGEELIPVHETEFARDNVFAYHHSDLKEYVIEKGRGTIAANKVQENYLRAIRALDAEEIARQLPALDYYDYLCFDALSYEDLRKLALAVILQFDPEKSHQTVVIRSSSSLPKALSGIAEQGYVSVAKAGAKGVVIVGSHVKKSTEQLNALLQIEGVAGIEIDVERILNDDTTQQAELLAEAERRYHEGLTPVFYTSRREVRCDDKAKRQALGTKISRFLVDLVRSLPFRPDFLVSKGGITSHDILTHSLEVRIARVAGQAAAGIPTIHTTEGPFADLLYVIFPGNVGAVETLGEVVKQLRDGATR